MAAQRTGYDTNVAVAFLWPFKTAVVAILIYVLLGLTLLGAAWVFSKYKLVDGWENPVRTSQQLFEAEAERVQSILPDHAGFAVMPALLQKSQRFAYWLFFETTTLHLAMQAHYQGVQVNEIDRIYLKQFVARNADTIVTSMNLIQVFGLRFGLLLAATPVFALVYLLATVDGFTERYIRRACAGRESSDINKMGRMSKLIGFAAGAMVYLCLPLDLGVFWVVTPLVVVMALATRLQWTYYKKYF